MTAIEKVSELLGGRKVLGKKLHSQLELIPLLRKGLPYEALESVTDKLDISVEVASVALQLARRTLARRKESNRLDAQESERIVRLADMAARATSILGTVEKAKKWLTADNQALGGAAPISLLDTDVGTRAVEDVLLRIEHGVYS
ncbi:MAG TPA: antitoxin Xre/MbcA/ParS toxin-binding domain-containing protein [Polyangiales bacterium]